MRGLLHFESPGTLTRKVNFKSLLKIEPAWFRSLFYRRALRPRRGRTCSVSQLIEEEPEPDVMVSQALYLLLNHSCLGAKPNHVKTKYRVSSACAVL